MRKIIISFFLFFGLLFMGSAFAAFPGSFPADADNPTIAGQLIVSGTSPAIDTPNGTIRANGGSAANVGFGFTNDIDTGLLRIGADDFALIGGALTALRVNNAGATIRLGFFSQSPAARTAAYTPTSVTPDRSYDADTVVITELADIVGTIIADIQLYGLFQ